MPSESAVELRREQMGLRARVVRLREVLAEPGEPLEPLAAAVGRLLPELFQHVSTGTSILADLLTERAGMQALGAKIEDEHLSLRSLARDLQLIVANPELYPFGHLSRLAKALADSLAAHLDFEERALLPPAR